MIKIAKRFRHDERGSMAIELCIVTPILVWVLISTFVYFDLFRTEANVERAAVTISDMLSREKAATSEDKAITPDYIDGTVNLLEALTFADDDPELRITVYRYDEPDLKYEVVWSQTEGTYAALTDSDLAAFNTAGKLPIASDGSISILVETRTEYVPLVSTNLSLFNMPYIDDHVFETFTVVRPRSSVTLCFDSLPAVDGAGVSC